MRTFTNLNWQVLSILAGLIFPFTVHATVFVDTLTPGMTEEAILKKAKKELASYDSSGIFSIRTKSPSYLAKLKLNKEGINGDTPLHFAVVHGMPNLARQLVDWGASWHAVNSKNETPRLLAERSTHILIRQLLGLQINLQAPQLNVSEPSCSSSGSKGQKMPLIGKSEMNSAMNSEEDFEESYSKISHSEVSHLEDIDSEPSHSANSRSKISQSGKLTSEKSGSDNSEAKSDGKTEVHKFGANLEVPKAQAKPKALPALETLEQIIAHEKTHQGKVRKLLTGTLNYDHDTSTLVEQYVGVGGFNHPLDEDPEVYRIYLRATQEKEPSRMAQGQLGQMYEKGTYGVEKDLDKAIHFYELGAKQGDASSQNSLDLLAETEASLPNGPSLRLKDLISRGANKNRALLKAAASNSLSGAQWLVEQKADVNYVNSKSYDAQSPTYYGLEKTDPVLEEVDLHDDTPLLLAARHGHTDMVTWLLVNHANPNTRNSYVAVTYPLMSPADLHSPLMRAAQFGHTSTIQALITGQAKVNDSFRDGRHVLDQRSALSFAAEGGHVDATRLLLENNATGLAKATDLAQERQKKCESDECRTRYKHILSLLDLYKNTVSIEKY